MTKRNLCENSGSSTSSTLVQYHLEFQKCCLALQYKADFFFPLQDDVAVLLMKKAAEVLHNILDEFLWSAKSDLQKSWEDAFLWRFLVYLSAKLRMQSGKVRITGGYPTFHLLFPCADSIAGYFWTWPSHCKCLRARKRPCFCAVDVAREWRKERVLFWLREVLFVSLSRGGITNKWKLGFTDVQQGGFFSLSIIVVFSYYTVLVFR